VGEAVTLKNLGTQTMSLHLFEYGNYDLGGTSTDSFAATESTSSSLTVWQTQEVDRVTFKGDVISKPTYWQVGTKTALEALLTDGSPTALNGTTFVGEGDNAWAMQWDVELAPGGAIILSKNLRIMPNTIPDVPEPGVALLLGAGALALCIRKRRHA
jgi:hypothetical protein